jgi:hypothetical protein
MTKNLLERLGWFDRNAESYAEFIEEPDKGNEENRSRNDASVKDKSGIKTEMQNQNNPDSLSQLNPGLIENKSRSDIEAAKK